MQKVLDLQIASSNNQQIIKTLNSSCRFIHYRKTKVRDNSALISKRSNEEFKEKILFCIFVSSACLFISFEQDRLAQRVAFILISAVTLLLCIAPVINFYIEFKMRREQPKDFVHFEDIFIVFDNQNRPIVVSKKGDKIKVLYQAMLVTANNRKIKFCHKPKKVQRAYLAMYPFSIFDIYQFISKPKGFCKAVKKDQKYSVNPLYQISQSDNGEMEIVVNSKMRRADFNRFIFDVKNEIVNSIYYCAYESIYYNLSYINKLSFVLAKTEFDMSDFKSILQNNQVYEQISKWMNYS